MKRSSVLRQVTRARSNQTTTYERNIKQVKGEIMRRVVIFPRYRDRAVKQAARKTRSPSRRHPFTDPALSSMDLMYRKKYASSNPFFFYTWRSFAAFLSFLFFSLL